MPDIIRPGYDQLVRAPTKTITFTGAAGSGAAGTVLYYTTTGSVRLEALYINVTTILAQAANTTSVGVVGNVACFVAAAIGTWAVGWVLAAGTGQVGMGPNLALVSGTNSAINANVIQTVTTTAITSGVIVVDAYYRPLSVGANLA